MVSDNLRARAERIVDHTANCDRAEALPRVLAELRAIASAPAPDDAELDALVAELTRERLDTSCSRLDTERIERGRRAADAIDRLRRAPLQSGTTGPSRETAWLVERSIEGIPHWLAWRDRPSMEWVTDANLADRFDWSVEAQRQARIASSAISQKCQATEHVFIGAAAQSPAAQAAPRCAVHKTRTMVQDFDYEPLTVRAQSAIPNGAYTCLDCEHEMTQLSDLVRDLSGAIHDKRLSDDDLRDAISPGWREWTDGRMVDLEAGRRVEAAVLAQCPALERDTAPAPDRRCVITVWAREVDVVAIYRSRGFEVLPPALTMSGADLKAAASVERSRTLVRRNSMTPIGESEAVVIEDGDVFDAIPRAL